MEKPKPARRPRKKGLPAPAAPEPPRTEVLPPGVSSTEPAPGSEAGAAAEIPAAPETPATPSPAPTSTAPAEPALASTAEPAPVPSAAEPFSARHIREVLTRYDDRKPPAPKPFRGSATSPPPAWEPDEVTLGFALTRDPTGTIRELPEPVVLATILCAVETERSRLAQVLSTAGGEEIEAVSSLFWPLLILPSPDPKFVAIFDGTGVWRRTFRYTLVPPTSELQSFLGKPLPPAELLGHMRGMVEYFGRDPGAQVLTVEGFLPVDPPLLFEVLSHVEFRSEPQSPHAGFLPARHEVAWYHSTVQEMQRWLDRFGEDLKLLETIRDQVQKVAEATLKDLDARYAATQAAHEARLTAAHAEIDSGSVSIHETTRKAVSEQLGVLRHGHSTIARQRISAATADTLTSRAINRQVDAGPHQVRERTATAEMRAANQAIRDARRRIEALHASERDQLEALAQRLAVLEQQDSEELASQELFRDEFNSVSTDLVAALNGQMAARMTQRNLLAGYFLPLTSLESIRIVWFPLWLATLRSPRGIRQLVFPPMQVRQGGGISHALKSLFGGVVLPLEPRTAHFDKVLRQNMEEALRKDTWFGHVSQEITRAADVLADPDVLERLGTGLQELRRSGWLTEKHVRRFLEAYSGHLAARARSPPSAPTAAPSPPSAAEVPPGTIS